jgi:hypothetical protein
MPLAINSTTFRNGPAGANGADGLDGSVISTFGDPGGDGARGTSVLQSFANQVLAGDAGRDAVSVSRSATGGAGGSGGIGGDGFDGQPQSSSSGGNSLTTYTAPGGAAAGGAGGLGGHGSVLFDALTFDLRTVPGGADRIDFSGTATGGASGRSGQGGYGGVDFYHRTTDASNFSTTTVIDGIFGGNTPDPRASAAGGSGRVVFEDVAILAGSLVFTVLGTAVGGRGGDGAGGTDGADGVGSAGNASAGSDGGRGGAALASLDRVEIRASETLTLQLNLSAIGGRGGDGGDGAQGGVAVDQVVITEGGGTSGYRIERHQPSSPGGDGADGGVATAQLNQVDIISGAQADIVTLRLHAAGGAGGEGGQGGRAVLPLVEYTQPVEREVIGTTSGPIGVDGSAGRASVSIRDTVVDLGADNDSLFLHLSGVFATFSLLRSRFEGGLGTDRLSLGTGQSGEPDWLVNLQAGTLRAGGGGAATLGGFEVIQGGGGADTILDATGDQTYSGGAGGDLFRFGPNQPGHDRIQDFGAGDIIQLRGFGPQLNSFAEVLLATVDTPAGALITTSPLSSILLAGVAEASLSADMFRY